ncbi:MAG: hypothetical protein Q9162_004234 [Coniocarpon cinnabarinum]
MADPGPVAHDYDNKRKVSQNTYAVGGIICDVFGLDEVPNDVQDVSCLWLLNPRLSKKEHMEPLAHLIVSAWNDKLSQKHGQGRQGLIACAFDQRNHGSRLVHKLSNQAWTGGNPRHAHDMFSIYQGTAADTSQLINYLPAYAFPNNERRLTSHFVLGVSLGAHAAWHCLLHDERISTAVIVVGCADYRRLMQQRAESSKLQTWTSSSPAGKSFVGSSDFPPALVEAVDKYDPSSLLMGEMEQTSADVMREPNDREKKRLWPLMRDHLAGKRILNQAGADDKLVPYSCSVPFLNWLKKAIGPPGWYAGNGVELVDKSYPGVGHAFTPEMASDATKFITELLDVSGRDSKI